MAKKDNTLLYLGAAAIGLLLLSKKSVGGIGKIYNYDDPDAVREIELYAENDSQLYRQRLNPIMKNLSLKHKKGKFNVDLAAKAFKYYIEDALKKYSKDFGGKWNTILSMRDRKLFAEYLAQDALDNFNSGNYTEI